MLNFTTCSVHKVVDLAGAEGTLIKLILKEHPGREKGGWGVGVGGGGVQTGSP
jgi:hypothetical protein